MPIEAHVGVDGVCEPDCPHSVHAGDLPPYDRAPVTHRGLPVAGWSWPPAPVADRRCWCGRRVLADTISTCGCCCPEHDGGVAS